MHSQLGLVAFAPLVLGMSTKIAPHPIDVTPTHVQFGSHPYETRTIRSFTISNRSDAVIFISIEQVFVGDDFSPGQVESTCPLPEVNLLEPGQTCTQVIMFQPSSAFGGMERALMRVVARDPDGNMLGSQDVRLSGRGF